jgi:hypothetical protein
MFGCSFPPHACEGVSFGSLEVLHFMEQTLADWREHKRALQRHL